MSTIQIVALIAPWIVVAIAGVLYFALPQPAPAAVAPTSMSGGSPEGRSPSEILARDLAEQIRKINENAQAVMQPRATNSPAPTPGPPPRP